MFINRSLIAKLESAADLDKDLGPKDQKVVISDLPGTTNVKH